MSLEAELSTAGGREGRGRAQIMRASAVAGQFVHLSEDACNLFMSKYAESMEVVWKMWTEANDQQGGGA